MKINKAIILFVIFSFSFIRCEYKTVYEKNIRIPNGVWQNKNAVRLWYDAEDTLAVKDISINLRHTGLYKYSNIYLFLTTQAPNGKQQRDTLEFTLANIQGKWFGRGLGDMYDIRMIYRKKVKFSQAGRYFFIIEQAMRDEKLEQITDIGLRIAPAK